MRRQWPLHYGGGGGGGNGEKGAEMRYRLEITSPGLLIDCNGKGGVGRVLVGSGETGMQFLASPDGGAVY